MNPFEFALAVIVILSVVRVIRYRMGDRSDFTRDWMNSRRRSQGLLGDGENDRENDGETRRLRDEVTQLKERLKVLERIAVDKENSLARQIDELRDGRP